MLGKATITIKIHKSHETGHNIWEGRSSLPCMSLSSFRFSCDRLATSQVWKTYAYLKQSSSASSKKGSEIMVLQESFAKDQPRRQLAPAGINYQSWQQEASDWNNWRSSVRKASHKFKTELHKSAKERCGRERKSEQPLKSSSAQAFTCPKCSAVCTSRMRPYSHHWASKSWPTTFCQKSAILKNTHLNTWNFIRPLAKVSPATPVETA